MPPFLFDDTGTTSGIYTTAHTVWCGWCDSTAATAISHFMNGGTATNGRPWWRRQA